MDSQTIPPTTSTFGVTDQAALANAYSGQLAADAVAQAKKRSANDAGFGQPAAKLNNPPAQTQRVVLEEKTSEELAAEAAAAKAGSANSSNTGSTAGQLVTNKIKKPSSCMDWRNLMTNEIIAQVLTIAETFSKSGDYVNVNPNSEIYNKLFDEPISGGWSFQVQTPPLVCTTGLKESEKYAGSWSALLAEGEVPELIARLNEKQRKISQQNGVEFVERKCENGAFFEFSRRLAAYFIEYLTLHGEAMFVEASKKANQKWEEQKQKNQSAKLDDPYRSNTFVSRGKSDPMYKAAYENGTYTMDQYRAEVSAYFKSFITTYDDKQSLQIKFYNEKIGEVRQKTPKVIIVNGETGNVEKFDPKAPYCERGKTSWETIIKYGIQWYNGSFILSQHAVLFSYHLNSSSGGGSGAGEITFNSVFGQQTIQDK